MSPTHSRRVVGPATLLACLLVATFEQPIGHSMQGFVMRHQVRWCEGFAEPIQIEHQMLRGAGGAPIGPASTDSYAVPAKKADTAAPPAVPTVP